jgi:hypothetical protein
MDEKARVTGIKGVRKWWDICQDILLAGIPYLVFGYGEFEI